MAWMCQRCGAPQEDADTPCEHCGNNRFERPYVRRSDRVPDDVVPPGEAPAPEQPAQQWVCTECGRAHPKHSPPCSRCGGMNLERETLEVDPAELSAGGYTDLATPVQLAVFGIAILAAAVVGIGVLGLADVPGVSAGSGSGELETPAAPGNATGIDGLSFAALETGYVERVNDERAEDDAGRLRRSDDLDELATFYNRWMVRAEYEGDAVSRGEARARLRQTCGREVDPVTYEMGSLYRLAEDPGVAIAERVLRQDDALADPSADGLGVDVHAAPDGQLFLTHVVC